VSSINLAQAIDVINRQIEAIGKSQDEEFAPKKKGAKKSVMGTSRLTSEVMTMARALASLLAEQRKAGEDAEAQLEESTPERIAALALRLIRRLSPEHRAACRALIDQLNGKLIAHGGE
jgi:hypothetical protein